MRPSPLDTYLAERLQSARGLGWPMPEAMPSQARPRSLSEPRPLVAWPNLLLTWLRAFR